MQYGVVYPQTELGGDPDAVRWFCAAAAAAGYQYVLAYDHVVGADHADREPPLTGPYTEHHPFHEPLVLFAYLAGMYPDLEFGTDVMILPQRQTVLVAKQAADLQVLSGGRLRLGVGTGWNWVEYDALGQPFAGRGARLDEQIGLLRRLWTEPLVSYEGRFDRMERGSILPRPAAPIPIWVGGFSDPAFRRAARLGDGFMFAGDVAHAEEGWARIRHFAAAEGRSLDGFGRDLTALRATTVDEAVATAEQWDAAGGSHYTVVSMRKGFTDVEEHISFIVKVAERLGIMPPDPPVEGRS